MGVLDYEGRLRRTLRMFSAAAIDNESWPSALSGLRSLTGGSATQLIGWQAGETTGVIVDNLDLALLPQWKALGGAELGNPLVRAGTAMQTRSSVPEDQLMSEEFRRRSALWQQFYEPNDIPHVRQGMVWRNGGDLMLLVAMHDRRRGPMPKATQRIFQRFVNAATDAAETARALGTDRAQLLAGALDLIETPVFVLDGFGQVLSVSAGAEAVLREQSCLTIRSKSLKLSDVTDQRQLGAAIARFMRTSTTLERPSGVVVNVAGPENMRLRVLRAPGRGTGLPVGACLMVIVERRAIGDVLTNAERVIMEALAAGASLQQIAMHRDVSVETVRTQSKTVYSKLGVSGQRDLMWLHRGLR